MTVASTLSKKHYQGNNLTTEFPLPFHVTAKEHIFAMLKKGTAVEEIKSNFAVDLQRKMFIYPVRGEALKSGESLTVYRKIPLTQIVDLENAGAFHPEVLEHDGFDRIVMQIQQLDEEINRALKLNITDTRDTADLLEELFTAREEALMSAQKALEQAQLAKEKAEKSNEWALFAEEKVKELTELEVECSVSNDGQGKVHYDKEAHTLEIVLPFDNSGENQPKMVLSDSLDLARSDIGASAKAVQSLQAKIQEEFVKKTSISNAINSNSTETVASSKAINDLRKAVPSLVLPSVHYFDYGVNFQQDGNGTWKYTVTPNANGYILVCFQAGSSNTFVAIFGNVAQCFNLLPYQFAYLFVPASKGGEYTLQFNGSITHNSLFMRFFYAPGELQ